MASNTPPLLPPGCRLAGYEVAALVGRGGMGEVYRAKQLSMQREVALKVLSPRLARQDPAFADQFVAEARAAGKLNHPNIVAVHDVGQAPAPAGCFGVETGEQIHYFSMEFIEGETVKDVIERQGAIDLATVGKVMAAMAEALAFAETHKIVHRDIKPDNIMLTTTGVVKLADLGLALQADSAEAVAGSKDDQGRGKVMGTPLYMAPEQARALPIDHRADQYALGATLFHMLTGTTPYQGESAKAIMRAHCFDPLPDPGEINPQVPPPWRDICLRMMAKAPEDRFAGAADLRVACKAAIRWRPGPVPRIRNARRSPPWLAIGISAAVLLVVAWWWMAQKPAQQPVRISPSPTPTTAHTPDNDEAALARAKAALDALPGDPVAALAAIEQLIKDPALAPAQKQLAARREALRATIEARRRAPLSTALEAAFADAVAGKLQQARDGLAKVADEGWLKPRRADVVARLALAERTVETRLRNELDHLADAKACDALADQIRQSGLPGPGIDALLARLDERRRELSAVKPPPKMQKVDTTALWRELGTQVEAARGNLPYGGLTDVLRNAARGFPDGDRTHIDVLSGLADAAQQAETALRLHIGQNRPRVECRFANHSGTFILTRLEKDWIGYRMVEMPAESRGERATAILPWSQLLAAAMSGQDAGGARAAAAFLWYWRLPEARAAIERLKDDPLAAAIATYERRTRAINIAGDQERRKDGSVSITYPFAARRDPDLLTAWKGAGAELSERGLRWSTTTLIPRGSTAEADLPCLAWKTGLLAPLELEARVLSEADSEITLVGLACPEMSVRVAFNNKRRLAFLFATKADDATTYQPHGANGTPEFSLDGVTVRFAVDGAGNVSVWINDTPVPGDRELRFPANARIAPIIQGRPLSTGSALTVQSLTVSGRP